MVVLARLEKERIAISSKRKIEGHIVDPEEGFIGLGSRDLGFDHRQLGSFSCDGE